MPYKSERQRLFFNANADKIGKKKVDEWNRESEGLKLPERVSLKRPKAQKVGKVKVVGEKKPR